MVKHLKITVSGSVQDVGFRYYTSLEAEKLGLTGFVENLASGQVYLEVEGEEDNLTKLVNFCQSGPARAKVEKVEVTEGPMKNFSNFISK